MILNEPGFEWVGEFLRDYRVEIVASMPCYSAENVNAQRGDGVFDRSISALQELNGLGFGQGDPNYPLNLVYNPGGAWLPPEQAELQADYKRELKKHFDITFDQLYALTNLPVSRFASLLAARRLLRYLHGASGQRVQSRHRRGSHVPRHAECQLAR